jgi:uncharacterized protein (DUF488 family)
VTQIYTIGYAEHTVESFHTDLDRYSITAVADVRSNPHSKFKPEFDAEAISRALRHWGIAYVFLGDECGARPDDPACYVDHVVSFEKVADQPAFQRGMERLREGMRHYTIALMCAEKDPVCCHRMILLCRHLGRQPGVTIDHIRSDSTCESNEAAEERLLGLLDLASDELPGLGRSREERLDEAYRRQGERIAYRRRQEKARAVQVRHA